MPLVLSVDEFIELQQSKHLLLIDSRSELEFAKGHIPEAVNIPLLNNEHRAIIGTIYKKKGRQEAVIKGFELVGPLFHGLINKTKELSSSNELLLYCWRGGMRSNIIAWLLTMAGFKVYLLKGGYKTYRSWCLKQFEIKRNIIILGGKTGSGKTALLSLINEQGEQTICLETLASHRGSAFGALGMNEQPAQEHFENRLSLELSKKTLSDSLWLENESRQIGALKIPDNLFEQMRIAPVIEMEIDHATRKQRILSEYGDFPTEWLAEKTGKLIKRMGGQHVKAALNYLADGNKEQWLELLLIYYDKLYAFGNENRDKEKIYNVTVDWTNSGLAVQQLIAKGKELKKVITHE